MKCEVKSKKTPVRFLHVVLSDLVGFGVNIDGDLSLGTHKPATSFNKRVGIWIWILIRTRIQIQGQQMKKTHVIFN
jgi:hypothetical protein